MSDLVNVSTHDGVRRLELNRPEKLNALSRELKDELSEHLASAVADPAARVIVLSGAGRAFSVGADVRPGNYAAARNAEEDRIDLLERSLGRFLEFWDAPKPVIAQVHGYCLGVATILCACCDIVVADEQARFGWPKLPLGAGMIGPVWAHQIGVQQAKRFSYQVGSELSGAEAAALGYAALAVPGERLQAEVDALATSIARTPSDLLRIKKEAINAVAERAGFRETLRQAAMWDALGHECASVDETRALIKERGLKQAIASFQAAKES